MCHDDMCHDDMFHEVGYIHRPRCFVLHIIIILLTGGHTNARGGVVIMLRPRMADRLHASALLHGWPAAAVWRLYLYELSWRSPFASLITCTNIPKPAAPALPYMPAIYKGGLTRNANLNGSAASNNLRPVVVSICVVTTLVESRVGGIDTGICYGKSR